MSSHKPWCIQFKHFLLVSLWQHKNIFLLLQKSSKLLCYWVKLVRQILSEENYLYLFIYLCKLEKQIVRTLVKWLILYNLQ